ncbi:MAG: Hpt domain-containing protein [bacterium]|nr:Hpt domain-containing protein [bacterium]
MDKITVHVDAELEAIIPRFFELRAKDIVVINESLGKKDFETIKRLGHSMKGAGGGYGFDYVSEIGQAIEEAAKKEDAGDIKEWILKLGNYLENIEVVYDEQVEGAHS